MSHMKVVPLKAKHGQRNSHNSPHAIFKPKGQRFKLKMRKKNKMKAQEKQFPQFLQFDLPGDFDHQIAELMVNIRLKPQDIQNFRYLCGDLERTLQSIFPGCVVHPFGSVVTGLAIQGSDIDCFVELSEENKRRIHYYSNPQAQKDIIFKSKKLFMSCYRIFTNIVGIPFARVPIIKLSHIASGYDADINFTNPYGVYNCKMLKFLFTLDSRLIPFFVFIKFWAKRMDIVGPNKLSNYSIVMMGIYYLQQLPKPILPPLSVLQRNSQYDYYVNDWNCGFDFSTESIPKTQNTDDLLTLLEGFFQFYASFVFDNVVICPFVGSVVKSDNFVNNTSLPDEYSLYFANIASGMEQLTTKILNVQDPIEQNRNVTVNASVKLKNTFQKCCSDACDTIKEARNKNIFDDLVPALLSRC